MGDAARVVAMSSTRCIRSVCSDWSVALRALTRVKPLLLHHRPASDYVCLHCCNNQDKVALLGRTPPLSQIGVHAAFRSLDMQNIMTTSGRAIARHSDSADGRRNAQRRSLEAPF